VTTVGAVFGATDPAPRDLRRLDRKRRSWRPCGSSQPIHSPPYHGWFHGFQASGRKLGIVQVPSWPSGHVKLDDDVLEFGAGDLHRVPVANLASIEVKPAKKGRLNLRIEYTTGLNRSKTGVWVEEQHEAELTQLVAAVQAAMA